jgi:hypothetical protein
MDTRGKAMHRKVNQYNAIKLNCYNDTFEIVSGNESEDGKFWMAWAIASEYDSKPQVVVGSA